MHGSTRGLALLFAATLGCSEEVPPLTGQANWADSCPGNLCPSMTHAPRGSRGSPAIDVDCSLTPSSGGYEVFFRIATLQPGEENFDNSQEGLLATGFLPAVGQELRMGALGGYVQVRGLGWSIARAPIGPSMDTGRCHVFIDRIASGGFSGRIACNAVNDDSTPARARNIRGATGASPDYGEFVFTNCATR